MKLKPILTGLLSQLPWLQALIHRRGTGGTCDPHYCYGVWLKHLTILHHQTQAPNASSPHPVQTPPSPIPRIVAELGPGDSLGIGFAALLSGAEQFIALDIERYANTRESNLAMFDQIHALFQARSPRPTKGWPDFDEHLDEHLFPSQLLTDDHLAAALAPQRIARLRSAIEQLGSADEDPTAAVRYIVPWADASVLEPGTVDMLISQSVLEHVNDLPPTYRAFHTWIKPGGHFSQQVDFTCHALAKHWNGHWACPEWLWRIILGKRSYLLNRAPYSTHTALAEAHGFHLITTLRYERTDGLTLKDLSTIAAHFTQADATTAGLFFQGRRQA